MCLNCRVWDLYAAMPEVHHWGRLQDSQWFIWVLLDTFCKVFGRRALGLGKGKRKGQQPQGGGFSDNDNGCSIG